MIKAFPEAVSFFPVGVSFPEGVMIHAAGGLDRRAYGEAPMTGSQAVSFCRLGGRGQKKTPSKRRQMSRLSLKLFKVAA